MQLALALKCLHILLGVKLYVCEWLANLLFNSRDFEARNVLEEVLVELLLVEVETDITEVDLDFLLGFMVFVGL